MARNSSGPTGLGRLGTWRSGGESPSFPGSGDARRLLEAVDPTPEGIGCTLVRVRLGASDRRTLVRVRERLLGEDPIVGTSIGRDAGPDDHATFDILVVPDCDPVTVGRAIADVDEVVGVAATAFESTGPTGRPSGGDADQEEADPTARTIVGGSVTDQRATARSGTDAEPDAGSGPTALARDDEVGLRRREASGDDGADRATDGASSAPSVGGIEALEETDGSSNATDPVRDGRDRRPDPPTGDGERGRRSDSPPRSTGRPRTSATGAHRESATGDDRESADGVGSADGDEGSKAPSALPVGTYGVGPSTADRQGHPEPGEERPRNGDDERERLDRLDSRLSELETLFDGDGRRSVPDEPPESSEGDPSREELEDRLESLEAAVADLEEWQRRLRAALIEDPPGSV